MEAGMKRHLLWMLAAGTALGTYCPCAQNRSIWPLQDSRKTLFRCHSGYWSNCCSCRSYWKVAVADRLVKMSEAQSAASELQKQVDELTQRLSDYQSGNPTDLDGVQAVYDNLIQAMQYYINDDKLSAAKALDKVDPDSLAGDEAKKFYKKIKKETYSTASESFL